MVIDVVIDMVIDVVIDLRFSYMNIGREGFKKNSIL